MHKAGWIALLFSLAGVVAAFQVAVRVFEAVPHVEDEMAYVWQAKALAHGQLTVPTPPNPQSLMIPFVVDANGHRSAKYPPGWPMVLALGNLLGIRTWVNPFLGGLAIWMTFRLGQKVFGTATGLLAALLTLTSPFFLINSGSLDSHPWSLVLSLAFVLAWLDSFDLGRQETSTSTKQVPRWLTVILAGLSLGLLVLTRPLTALGLAMPFFLCGLALIWRGNALVRARVLCIGGLALLVGALFLAWQFAVTGSPFTNPYTLWWKFDRLGFGPGIGTTPGGHTLLLGLKHAGIMLAATTKDLFGWMSFSWLFLPFGLWAMRRNQSGWLLFSVFIGLVITYIFYWAYVVRYGPRYYYEGLYSLTLVSAAGIVWLTGRIKSPVGHRIWTSLMTLLTTALVIYNLSVFLPHRLDMIHGLYGIHRAQLAPFLTLQARENTPALVFVSIQKSWTDYAGLLELEDPWLTSAFIFALSINPSTDVSTAADYPGREILYYYPDEPDRFYTSPR